MHSGYDNITVCIFAYNEEKRILRCVENFKNLFENILVVSNDSTDGTECVCRQSGVRCERVKNPGFIETPEVMDKVESFVNTEYMLVASVSEFIPLELLDAYAEVAERGSHDVVYSYRVSVTAGQQVPVSGRPTDRKYAELRFFKKGSVSYVDNKVHGRGLPMTERILDLWKFPGAYFYQFRDYDCAKTERSHANYNDKLAYQLFSDGIRFSFLKMAYRAARQFFGVFFIFGCYKYGMLGFIQSYYRAQMEVNIWLRIWEYENGFEISGVKRLNDEARAEMESALAKNESRYEK